MPKAEQSVVINAPLDQVFAVITDYEAYPEFLPEMQSAVVESREGGIAVVRFELELVMRISYTLRLEEEEPNAVQWRLESAKMMTENRGGWQLAATDDGQTHAIYTIEIGLRGLIPKSVTTRLVGETLPRTLDLFKNRAESLAGTV